MEEEIKQVETISVPETPVQLPKKSNLSKIVPLFILGLIILAGAIYAGVIIGKKLNPPEVIPQVVEASPTPDETADWETYTNDSLDFTLRYPPNLEVKENIFSIKEGRIEFNSQLGSVFAIEYLGVAGAFGERCEGDPNETVKVSLLGGSKTACMNEKSLWACEFSNPNKSGEFFSIGADFGEDLSKEVVLQILSTFKFLDQPSLAPKPTAGWKISIFPKLGVQLNLPPLWFIHEEIVVGGLGTVTTNISYPVNNPSPQVYMENQKVSVNISVRTKTKGLEERAKEYTQVDFEPLKITGQKTIGGEEALVLELENSEQPFQVYLVDNKKLSYYISISIPIEYNQEAKPLFSVFDQILSTFKFLD